MTKIKDKFKFLPKSDIPASAGQEKGYFPFYTSSYIQNKFVDEYLYEGDSIILGSGGSKVSIHFQNQKFAVTTDCFVLQPKVDDYSTKLLYYFLYGNIYILKKGFQGVGIPHIPKKYIENIEIPDFDKETQIRLVAQLDLIQSMLDHRKKAINTIDQLVRSIFLDMFHKKGNGKEKWKEWEIRNVLANEKGSRTGPFGSHLKHSEFKETGDVAVLGIDNAVNNEFNWAEKRFISISKYNELRNYRIYPRDVIVTIMGTIGKSAVIPEDIPLAINTKHLAALTLNSIECNPYYLAQAIQHDPLIKFQLKAKSRGAIMSGLNLNIIRNIKFKKPPIELQNKFEFHYKIMIKRKEMQSNSLKLMDTLFKSLIHLALNKNGIDKTNEVEKYINDIVLQQELIGKINTQDFNVYEDYQNSKKLLFELLNSGKSRIKQVYDSKSKKMKLLFS